LSNYQTKKGPQLKKVWAKTTQESEEGGEGGNIVSQNKKSSDGGRESLGAGSRGVKEKYSRRGGPGRGGNRGGVSPAK